MKQFTTPEQTAKLIELGLPKPKSIVEHDGYMGYNYAYSIGELIEMIGVHLSLIYYIGMDWIVSAGRIERRREELINALFDMIVKLREVGVI